jgi:peptidoglycan/xylan/chitin deacetylase (PgdA/CDA1 family)
MIASLTAASVGLLGSAAYFSPIVWRRSRMNAVRREVTRDRILALTFDDGPSETLTPRLLDLLRKHEAMATFFMLGRNARQLPHLVDRVIREGHDIGCHSDQHLNAWKSLPWRAVSDINAGYETLCPWIPSNGMFRPPHGKMTLSTYLAIRRRGAPVWWWTIDSGDTHAYLPNTEQVLDQVRRQNGGIVLLHDLDRSKQRDEFVFATTTALLELANRESLNIMPLSKLCR